MPVPRGITSAHVCGAIDQLGSNETLPPFRMPTRFWLHDRGHRYAPKAVLGLARQIAHGGELVDDFSGGDGPSGANTILRNLGYTVEPFRDPFSRRPRRLQPSAAPDAQLDGVLGDEGSPYGRIGFWWVNQRPSYRQERAGGYMWAPLRDGAGHRLGHWDAIADLRLGDVVLHYADGAVRAIGLVTAEAVLAPRPGDLPQNWEQDGRLAKVAMTDVEPALALADIPLLGRLAEQHGPFNVKGGVKQAYLFPVSTTFAESVLHQVGLADVTPANPRNEEPTEDEAGPGLPSDPALRKAIERYAVETVKAGLAQRFVGCVIREMGANNPGYDLEVRRDGEVTLYVEVKGHDAARRLLCNERTRAGRIG